MISNDLILICTYSIVLAVIIGLIRLRSITADYQPFILITLTSLANEVAASWLEANPLMNAVRLNIFFILESLLWIWQFKRWGGFSGGRKRVYPALLISVAVVWTAENILFAGISTFNSMFSLVSYFILVFLAINQVNQLIVEERGNMLKNSRFLICSGVMIFYTYKIMIESFYVMKLDQSNQFLSKIFIILVFVNLFVNLLYALATLWIPTRQRFTMQY